MYALESVTSDSEREEATQVVADSSDVDEDTHDASDSEPSKSDSVNETETFSLDDAILHMGFGWFQIRVLCLTGVVFAADAMEMMLLTFLMPEVKEEWNLESGKDAMIGSVVFVGMGIGAAFWGRFSDRHGRRLGYLLVSLVTAIFGLLSSFSPNLTVLAICRFGVGFGLGGSMIPYAIFVEFVPRNIRARILLLSAVFWTCGALFGTTVAWFTIPTQGWRYYLVYCSLPLFIICLFYFWLPESPRYLMTAGRVREAEDVILLISKANKVPLPPGNLIDPYQLSNEETSDVHRGSFRDLIHPSLLVTTLLMWTIWFAAVFGYYGISFITPRFFEHEGSKYESVFITTLAEFPGILIPLYMVEKGRRRALTLTYGLFALCSFALIYPAMNEDAPYVYGVVFIFVARMNASASFSVLYIYTSEVYPTAIRTTAIGACSSFGRVAGIITTFVSEDIDTFLGVSFYGIVAALSCLACYCLPIGTAGVALRDQVSAPVEEVKKTKKKYEQLEEFSVSDIGD